MLKTVFPTILLIVCSLSYGQNNLENTDLKYDFAGKLSPDELKFTKLQFDWDSEDILIVNYTQLRTDCHFDNHTHKINSGKWWRKFYSETDISNSLVVFLCSEKHEGIKGLYVDRTNFFLKHFFSRKKSCFAVLIINKNGDYLQFNGHYSEEQVSNYTQYLKSLL